ncbi:MAG: hypothetical protein RLZZ574_406 [Cyanobacteriota bacterium]
MFAYQGTPNTTGRLTWQEQFSSLNISDVRQLSKNNGHERS